MEAWIVFMFSVTGQLYSPGKVTLAPYMEVCWGDKMFSAFEEFSVNTKSKFSHVIYGL